jgi:hypothetical protein
LSLELLSTIRRAFRFFAAAAARWRDDLEATLRFVEEDFFFDDEARLEAAERLVFPVISSRESIEFKVKKKK